jgi:hypothetical protein
MRSLAERRTIIDVDVTMIEPAAAHALENAAAGLG